MLENATNLTTQSDGTAIGYIIDWLKAFFSEAYAEPTLIAILIGVTIMLFFFECKVERKCKHIERIQQEYDKLLKPDAVKLEYDNGVLKYSLQDDLDWDDFFSEVKRQKKYRKYKVDELYEKAENAVNKFNSLSESVQKEIVSTFFNGLNNQDSNWETWNGDGREPSTDYVVPQVIPQSVDYLIHKTRSLIQQKHTDGRHTLLCNGIVAKTGSESKKVKLRDLILSLADDEKIKGLITNRDEAEKDVDQALKEHNDKLAEVIRDLRMYPRGGFFR